VQDGEDSIVVEADARKMPDLQRNLKLYRLRRKVDLEPMKEGVYFSSEVPACASKSSVFEVFCLLSPSVMLFLW
jgi:folate-binding Fe-S cluster repair protein YgfZ